MSTEVEERVARAILEAANAVRNYPDEFCSYGMSIALARAAIAAVRAYDAETLSSVVLGKDGEVETCA